MPSLQAEEISDSLLARARAGDTAAQEQIYRQLARPVYTLVRRLVLRPAIAEELLHDVFVEILKNLRSFQATGSFVGWVKSIAVSKALMYLRSPWHRGLAWLDSEEVPNEHLPADDGLGSRRDLERALALLPAVSRTVVWLHDVEGFTHAEIASVFGRTVSFSKSQLARAHEQLRSQLESDSGGLACTPLSKNS